VDFAICAHFSTESIDHAVEAESFKRWITDTVFGLTYGRPQAGSMGM
jgi:hypothetical protein